MSPQLLKYLVNFQKMLTLQKFIGLGLVCIYVDTSSAAQSSTSTPLYATPDGSPITPTGAVVDPQATPTPPTTPVVVEESFSTRFFRIARNAYNSYSISGAAETSGQKFAKGVLSEVINNEDTIKKYIEGSEQYIVDLPDILMKKYTKKEDKEEAAKEFKKIIEDNVSALGKKIVQEAIYGSIESGIEELEKNKEKVTHLLEDIFKEAFESTKKYIEDNDEDISKKIDKISKQVSDRVKKITEAAGESLMDGVTKGVEKNKQGIKGIVSEILRDAFGGGLISKVFQFVKDTFYKIASFLSLS